MVGAVNAITCADMAMAGVESKIPVDQVIDCMGDVGRRMPVEFRETALGGLAVLIAMILLVIRLATSSHKGKH